MSFGRAATEALRVTLGGAEVVRELIAAIDAAPQAAAGFATAQNVTIDATIEFEYENANNIVVPENVAAALQVRDSAGRIYARIRSTTGDKAVNFGDPSTGTGVSFFGQRIPSRPAAYTQTYSTATRTHAGLTSLGVLNGTSEIGNLATFGATNAADQSATLSANFLVMLNALSVLRSQLVLSKQSLNQIILGLSRYGLLSYSVP